jgi:hypothetical protein
MKTFAESQSELVDSSYQTTSADAPARFVTRNLHRVWQIRRMQVTLLRPFRKVLRPLAHWLMEEHFYVETGEAAAPKTGLHLRTLGWESMALGVVLAPLVFLMLLPLLLIILPVAAFVGLLALIASAVQTGMEEAGIDILKT